MNFVAEWTTISAPYSNGRIWYGVANVESTTRGILCLCAMSATAWMSMRFAFGLPIDSMRIARVFSRIASSNAEMPFVGSTNVVSMP